MGEQLQLNNFEQVENEVKSIRATEWKKTLTGALDNHRLLGALGVLSIFYFGYIIFGVIYDNNANDEDDIVHSCRCKPTHRQFFIGWSIFCYILWVIWHLLIFFLYEFPPTKKHKKCCKSKTSSYSPSGSNFHTCKSLLCFFYSEDIYRYESYLWTQYYELYVLGIAKNEMNFSLDKVQKYIARALNESNIDGQLNVAGTEDKRPLTNHDELANNNARNIIPLVRFALPADFSSCKIQFLAQLVIHVFLFCVRLAAQAAIVPLLMIQMFDTYAFLCFASDNYCNMRAEYKLHFDQTAVTFGFYCSLMISLLTTTMLRWIPFPKKIIIRNDNNNVVCQNEHEVLY